ncbi:MAG: flagellar basal body P-ring protein FlgI [Lautropia sp.]|nr:flagellar basal body P-ring protein FlgI [Lautropia sp.]
MSVLLCLSVGFGVGIGPVKAERLKEVASIQGVRTNQLLGYGLMVGLDGTGDQTTQAPFTAQSMKSLLSQLGIQLPPGTTPQLKNSAAVIVTAQLPAFAQPGQMIDVTVSSVGNAKSLRGGTLLLTPLRGVDGQVYAVAQGNVVVGGAGASAGGSKVQINHLSAGRIPAGATVERVVPNDTLAGDSIRIEMNRTDFTSVRLVTEAINQRMRSVPGADGRPAVALDARVIEVPLPRNPAHRVGFLAELESMDVTLANAPAKVIINARTGSVVMNQAVSLAPSAVAHGNLSVTVSSTPLVSQPAPLSQGQTVAAEMADITVRQEGGAVMMLQKAAQLKDVVGALNSLGANPQDLIAILQALQAAGSLKAELEII